QQRATMLEAELSQHRMSTSELIHRVNELEALVAEARRRQQETPPQDDHTTGEPLSARLRKGRQAAETQELEAVPVDTAPAEVDERVIDDDLAQRRARLMRKD
ncbi:MAG: hypothetical protein JW910_08235, partial [Anaerolineae bacterium]|nr:hypothetical protein [Anaerolineae bacterium]